MISPADREAWERDGYVVLALSEIFTLACSIKADVNMAHPECRVQRMHERGGNPRVFQLWKLSESVKQLATHPEVVGAIAELTGATPVPFQTLNFAKGTQQPLHQDTIHFDSERPPSQVVGAWVALENVQPGSGELLVCPGSHREKRWDYGDFGISRPQRGTPEEAEAYRRYEVCMERLATRYDPYPLRIRKGYFVLWHGNLIHGGAPITDPDATRWSQATHYFLEGASRYFCPMFGTDKDLAALRIA